MKITFTAYHTEDEGYVAINEKYRCVESTWDELCENCCNVYKNANIEI